MKPHRRLTSTRVGRKNVAGKFAGTSKNRREAENIYLNLADIEPEQILRGLHGRKVT